MIPVAEIFEGLCRPFPIEEISWRVGPTNERSRKEDQPLRGQPLCYVDARTVMDRFDAVMGFNNWQNTYSAGVGNAIVCNVGLCIGGEWIWKADGAGASDTEPEKGMLSDAFKRAAVRWGVGRYLYELKAPWIDLERRGNSAIIKPDDFPRLNALHDDMAKRSGWGDIASVGAYRILVAEVEALPSGAREGFKTAHHDRIERLPPAMRRHLLTKLEAA